MLPKTSSIVVCTRNRLDDIVKFIPSVAQQSEAPNEFIIVDASDIPLNQQAIFINVFEQAKFPYTKLMYHHTKQAGTACQRNVGAQLATTDILHFVDDDTILSPHYTCEMNKIFNNYSEYAGGMGCVTNVPPKTDNIHRLLRVLFLLPRDYSSGNFTLSGMPTHAYGTNRFKFVQVLGGCCMSYRRVIFLQYLFDDKLGQYAYLEDVDVAWRVSQKYTLFYNPAARLQHLKSPVNRATVAERKALFLKNYSYLFFKNVYSTNKMKLCAYWWSIGGLFICAFLSRDIESFKGYWRGLKCLYSSRY